MSVERITADKFGDDDELFLFGDGSQFVVDPEADQAYKIQHGPDAIFSKKHDLSFKWLAQFWQGEIPDQFFEEESRQRKDAEDISAQADAEWGGTGKHERLVRDDAVAAMLYIEWYNDLGPRPMEERAVLSTALLFAFNALVEDPLRDEKLSYVIELSAQADNLVWGDGRYAVPAPLEGYADRPFPIHVVDK